MLRNIRNNYQSIIVSGFQKLLGKSNRKQCRKCLNLLELNHQFGFLYNNNFVVRADDILAPKFVIEEGLMTTSSRRPRINRVKYLWLFTTNLKHCNFVNNLEILATTEKILQKTLKTWNTSLLIRK